MGIAAPEPDEPDGMTRLVLELGEHRESVQRGDWFDCSCGEAYIDWACHIAEIMKDALDRRDRAAEDIINVMRTQVRTGETRVMELQNEIVSVKERLSSCSMVLSSTSDTLRSLYRRDNRFVDQAREMKAANERRWGPRRKRRIDPEQVIELLGKPSVVTTLENAGGGQQVTVPELGELRGWGGKVTTQVIGLKWIATYTPPRRWLRRRGGVVTAVSDGHEEDALGLLRIAVAARGLT